MGYWFKAFLDESFGKASATGKNIYKSQCTSHVLSFAEKVRANWFHVLNQSCVANCTSPAKPQVEANLCTFVHNRHRQDILAFRPPSPVFEAVSFVHTDQVPTESLMSATEHFVGWSVSTTMESVHAGVNRACWALVGLVNDVRD